FHEVDSSEMAFMIAGSMAFQDAAKKARPVLLEPIMAVEVAVPEEYLGNVIGDLNSRRGRIESMELQGTTQIIRAACPFRRCSATRAICAFGHRVARLTRHISIDTNSYPEVLLMMTRTASLLWLRRAHLRRKAKLRAWRSPSQITRSVRAVST